MKLSNILQFIYEIKLNRFSNIFYINIFICRPFSPFLLRCWLMIDAALINNAMMDFLPNYSPFDRSRWKLSNCFNCTSKINDSHFHAFSNMICWLVIKIRKPSQFISTQSGKQWTLTARGIAIFAWIYSALET